MSVTFEYTAAPTTTQAAAIGEQLDSWVATWNAFYEDIIVPAIQLVIPIVLTWLLILLITRLIAITPLFYGITVTRRTSLWARVIGFAFTGGAAIAFVSAASTGEPAITPPEGVLPVMLAIFGIWTYALGMASRPILAATVTGPDGAANTALTTELLARMRELNADDTRGRVEQPSTSDLNEIIAVAGTSDNWLVNLVGGAMSSLFNITPWRLDVTVLDKRSGQVALHRNGKRIDEASLRLPTDPVDAEHPAELLALAAAFGAVTVAKSYPDIVGFYGAQDWRGIGLLAAGRRLPMAKRRVYLARALEADPQSILVEHAELFDKYNSDADAAQLESLMDSLEPMIRKAAALCSVHRPELDRIPPKPWHVSAEGSREPHLLMLRMMALYTTLVRNWTALAAAEDTAKVGERRARAVEILEVFVDELPRTPPGERRAAHNDLRQMEQRASLSYALLREPDFPIDLSDPLPALTGDRRRRWEWARKRLMTARDDNDFDVRYSYACYLARRRHDGDTSTETDPERIAERIDLVLTAVDDYRAAAMDDPELRLLSAAPAMRGAVLARQIGAWDIQRFARHRDTLEAQGIIDPVRLAAPNVTAKRLRSEKVDLATAQSLVDGAKILAALQRARATAIDESARLRAARALLDVEGHSIESFIAACSDPTQRTALRKTVGKALFWDPSTEEQALVREFIDRVAASLRSERPSVSPAAGRTTPSRDGAPEARRASTIQIDPARRLRLSVWMAAAPTRARRVNDGSPGRGRLFIRAFRRCG